MKMTFPRRTSPKDRTSFSQITQRLCCRSGRLLSGSDLKVRIRLLDFFFFKFYTAPKFCFFLNLYSQFVLLKLRFCFFPHKFSFLIQNWLVIDQLKKCKLLKNIYCIFNLLDFILVLGIFTVGSGQLIGSDQKGSVPAWSASHPLRFFWEMAASTLTSVHNTN